MRAGLAAAMLLCPLAVAGQASAQPKVNLEQTFAESLTALVREAEERALPIYVLKANTIPQMESSLTSIFALEIDPRDMALRETEEAIGVVRDRSEPVELSPQNAYIRRLQHQMAERAKAHVSEATGSHSIYVSKPKTVAALIEAAAKAQSK